MVFDGNIIPFTFFYGMLGSPRLVVYVRKVCVFVDILRIERGETW